MAGMFDVTLILEDIVKRDGVSRNTNRYDATTEQLTEMSFIPEGDVYRLIVRCTSGIAHLMIWSA